MPKKIYLIDANSFIYRMFFAIPEFATKEGKIVNATFWMAKFFTGQLVKENPDYIIFIKDARGENFRHKIYPEYKATRDKMPDTLREQIGDIEEMVEKMQIDRVEISGYEADDVIATLAKKLEKETDNEVYILSSDKDLYALVSEQVKIYDTQKKKISWPKETKEKFWVDSEYVTDYLAICGDVSDNIPGVKWIGPKKVELLINAFWWVEEIYKVVNEVYNGEKTYKDFEEKVGKIFKGKTFEKLYEWKENAFLSKRLATLACDVDMWDFDISEYDFKEEKLFTPEVIEFFEKLEFHSLIKEKKEKQKWKDTWKKVKIIWDDAWIEELEEKIKKYNEIVIDTETTDLRPQDAKLVGVSILLDQENIFYINRLHNWPRVTDEKLQWFLQKLFDSDKKIIGHNLKYDLEIITLFLRGKWLEKSEENPQSMLF